MNPRIDPHCIAIAFSNSECESIIELGESIGLKASGIDDDKNFVLRIKEEDVNGYSYWNLFNPVYIFIAYNYNKKYILVNLNKIIQEMKKVEQEIYPDNNLKYRTIQIDKLIEYDRITLF